MPSGIILVLIIGGSLSSIFLVALDIVLQNGNNLAMNYLDFVESDCFEKLSLSGTTQAGFLHGELDESEDLSFMNVLHTF